MSDQSFEREEAHHDTDKLRHHAERSISRGEAMRYVDPNEILALLNERDALAAHVERLNTVLFQTMAAIDDGDIEAIPYDLARDVHNEAPETNLARRDLLKQAEAFEIAERRAKCMQDATMLRLNAADLRRQAEGK